MKKGVKIFLIIFILLLLVVGSVGGTLFYSYKQLSYTIGDTQLTNHIYMELGQYLGYIEVKTALTIKYDGLYPLRDLSINLEIYGENFSITQGLNGKLLGKGNNTLGDITRGNPWNGFINTNVTQYVSTLAIEDCDMRIIIYISVKIDFFLFKVPLSFTFETSEHWTAPYL